MKKTMITCATVMLLSSCVVNTKTVGGAESYNPATCTVKPEAKTMASSNRIWFLFIPFGGKGNDKRESQCFNRMVRQNNADGVLAQKYVHKKITIPLIVFTYSFRTTTLTGKPFVIKTDTLKK